MYSDLDTGRKHRGLSSDHFERHPCFNRDAIHAYARIHLPVAPRCNVQCRFCDRKFSCVNESRPGVTADVLTPRQALERLRLSVQKIPNISVVGIAGPGDPFANPEETLETFHLVRRDFPGLMLCVSSNGLNLLPYVDDIADLGVSHVTVTVNAVNALIGKDIYEWVSVCGKAIGGEQAASLLWERQKKAIIALSSRRVIVKINTVCVPGINDAHIPEISRTVAALGASLHNIIPLIPVRGTPFAGIGEPSREMMGEIRRMAKLYLPQMEHCSRCRADACGLLGSSPSGEPAEQIHDRVSECPARERCPRGSATGDRKSELPSPGTKSAVFLPQERRPAT